MTPAVRPVHAPPAAPPAVPPPAPPVALAADEPGRPTRWRLGWLAPAVLVGWLALDVALRFAPPAWFRVNPLVAAVRRPARSASFQPNFVGVTANYVGDAVLEANRRPTERRPPVRVTTDERGFRRNPYIARGDAPDVLMLGGASFGYGAALSDHETLPAVLTRLTGLRAYNGALSHHDELTTAHVDRLLASLPTRPRLALLVLVEHEELPLPKTQGARGRAVAIANAVPPLAPAVYRARAARQELREVERRIGRWWDFSPLRIVTGRVFKRLSNDRVMPNEYGRTTRTLTLPDGRPMVVRGYELYPARNGRSPTDAPRTAASVLQWRDSLAARGMDTRVLLLPSRYSVYGPELERGAEREGVLRVVAYLDSVAARLRAGGVRTVNGREVFAEVAARELRTGELSFYRDDNHWNPRGVHRIACVLADSLVPRRDPACGDDAQTVGALEAPVPALVSPAARTARVAALPARRPGPL